MNPSFIVLLGAIALLIASQTRGGIEAGSTSIVQSLVGVDWGTLLGKLFTRPLSGLIAIVLLVALLAYVDAKGTLTRVAWGLPHWVAHIAVVVTSMWGALAITTWMLHLHADIKPSSPRQIAAFVVAAILVFVVAAIGGGVVFGGYLWLAERMGHHANDAFAALHMTAYKNFLRIKLKPDGSLHIFPLGIDKVSSWIPRASDDVGDAIDPMGPPTVHLIEPPIHVVPPPIPGTPPASGAKGDPGIP